MVRLHHLQITLLLLMLFEGVHSQDRPYSISLSGIYVTSAKIFHSYDASDPVRRDQFFTIPDIFGIGIDLRREFPDLRLQIGLRMEYMETHEEFNYAVSRSETIPVKDGFRTIPVEITGYFLLPIPIQEWKFTVGAGIGIYWGSRDYTYSTASPEPLERKIGGGIHIVSAVEIPFSQSFGIRTEVKFRDAQFWSSEEFSEKYTITQGHAIMLSSEKINSKILIDGLTLSAGIVYNI